LLIIDEVSHWLGFADDLDFVATVATSRDIRSTKHLPSNDEKYFNMPFPLSRKIFADTVSTNANIFVK
jgi:hypothetical protein